MPPEPTIEIKFKIKDDGSVVLDKIGGKFQDTKGHVEDMNRSLSIIKWDSIVNLGERAYRTGEKIYNMAKQAASAGDEIQRQAKILNMTTGEYQKWQYVAYRADVNQAQLAAGMKILSKNMLKVAEGSQEQIRTFEMLGVQVKDQEGKLKNYDEILGDLADRFQRMPDGPEKVALALQAFGKSGEAMIPLLDKGRQGIEELREEFEKLGIGIDPGTIEKLAKADEQFEKFEARLKTVTQLALAPVVEEVGNLLGAFLKLDDLINRIAKGENISEAISKTIGNREAYLKARKDLKWLTGEQAGELEKIEVSKIPAAAWVKEWAAEYKPKQEVEKEAAIIGRDADRWKKWVEEFDDLTYSYEKLGIKSTAVLSKEATDALRYAEVIKKAFQEKKASVNDYVNALNVANDAMKKLTGEDVTDQLVKNEEEYQKRIQAISPEDPERQKQVQAAIDDWQKAQKEIEKTAKIPVQADVAPMERQVQESIRKLQAQGITIPVTTSGGEAATGGGGGTSWEDYVKGNTEFFQGGKKAIEDMNESFQDWSDQWGEGLDVPISFYGIGSTKKPITEKIQEIISEFGGLEKALSSMEAEINVAELSVEYKKLETKLNQLERILPDMSAIASASGGSPYVGGPIVQTVKDLTAEYTEQMRILQMKMDYQMLRAYGGSYQTGTHYVPETGIYKLHEGEQVLPQNYSFGNIPISVTINGVGSSPEDLVRVFKYSLAGELTDAIRKALSARSRRL